MAQECEYHTNFDRMLEGVLLPDHRDLFDTERWYALLHQHCFADRSPLILECGPNRLFLLDDGNRRYSGLSTWYSFRTRITGPVTGWGMLAQSLRVVADQITLSPVPKTDADAMIAAFNAAGWLAVAQRATGNHWLDVAGRDFTTYWAQRPGMLRSTVKRKGKKGLVDISLSRDFDPDHWAAYEAIYAQSWKPSEGNPAFLRALAESEAKLGNLRFGLARVDDQPVAAQFWTVAGKTAYIHKLANIEGMDAQSPGTLLSHALFRQAIDDDRVERIDFGTGDDPYKRDWVDQADDLMRVHFYNKSAWRTWPAVARAWMGQLARSLRRG